jgi:hypothetical protein
LKDTRSYRVLQEGRSRQEARRRRRRENEVAVFVFMVEGRVVKGTGWRRGLPCWF